MRRRDDPVGRFLRDLVRSARWHRRLLAAGLAAGATAFGLHALAPPPPPAAAVVVAAAELPAGRALTGDDLEVVRLPAAAVPEGALTRVADALGSTVLSPVRRGEVVTDVRLLAVPALARLGAGLVAVPVRVADPETAALVRPGSVVDVLAAGTGTDGATGSARLVASAVRVLTVPAAATDAFGATGTAGALVVLATTETTAVRLAGAAVADRLSLVLRGS